MKEIIREFEREDWQSFLVAMAFAVIMFGLMWIFC
jgi:hypothetical protein